MQKKKKNMRRAGAGNLKGRSYITKSWRRLQCSSQDGRIISERGIMRNTESSMRSARTDRCTEDTAGGSVCNFGAVLPSGKTPPVRISSLRKNRQSISVPLGIRIPKVNGGEKVYRSCGIMAFITRSPECRMPEVK